MPSVVYEYVYDILKNRLTIAKHGVRSSSKPFEEIILDNGSYINPHTVFGMNTPTQYLFTKGVDKWKFCPECAFLAGYSWARLNRGKVVDVARRISKSLFEGHIANLSRNVGEARANMNKARNALKAADAVYRAYAEKLEKTDE